MIIKFGSFFVRHCRALCHLPLCVMARALKSTTMAQTTVLDPRFKPLHVRYAFVTLPLRICTPFRPSLPIPLRSYIRVRIYSEQRAGLLSRHPYPYLQVNLSFVGSRLFIPLVTPSPLLRPPNQSIVSSLRPTAWSFFHLYLDGIVNANATLLFLYKELLRNRWPRCRIPNFHLRIHRPHQPRPFVILRPQQPISIQVSSNTLSMTWWDYVGSS